MANANVNITVTANSQQAQSNLSTFSNKFTELYSNLMLIKQGAEIVGGVVKTALQFAREGAEVELLSKRLDNLTMSIGLTSDALMDDLREATRGLVSDADLMKNAADIISLGLASTGEGVVDLAQLISALGWDMQTVILTFANNSKMRLDALGLSVTDVESRMKALEAQGYDTDKAFDMAVIEAGKAKLELLGNAAETSAGSWKRLDAEIANAKMALQEFLGKGLTPYITGTHNSLDALEAQIDAAHRQNLTWEEMLETLGVAKPAIEALNLATLGAAEAKYQDSLAAQADAKEVERLMNTVSDASDATVAWTENTFYAEQAQAALGAEVVSTTGTLYAMQQAQNSVLASINFTSDATKLLNEVLVQEGDTLSETNRRKIEYLLATGEITKAEYEDLMVKNLMIQRLENLNSALAGNIISQEQWQEILRDGIVTVQELNAAMTATWNDTLNASLDASRQETEDMTDAMQGAYDTTKDATEAMINFAQTALDSGQPLSALAGSLGGVVDPLETGASKAKELDDSLTNLDGRTVNAQVIVDFIARTGGGTGGGVGDTPVYTLRIDEGAGIDKAPPVTLPTGPDEGDLLGRMLAARDAMYGRGVGENAPSAPGAGRDKGSVPFAPGMGDGKGGGVGMTMPGGFGQMANLGGVPVMLTINYYNTPPSVIDDLQMVAQMAQTGA